MHFRWNGKYTEKQQISDALFVCCAEFSSIYESLHGTKTVLGQSHRKWDIDTIFKAVDKEPKVVNME